MNSTSAPDFYHERLQSMALILHEAEAALQGLSFDQSQDIPDQHFEGVDITLPCGVRLIRGVRYRSPFDEALPYEPTDYIALHDGKYFLKMDIYDPSSYTKKHDVLAPVLHALPGEIAEFDLLTQNEFGASKVLDAATFQSWAIGVLNGKEVWRRDDFTGKIHDIRHIWDYWPKDRSIYFTKFMQLIFEKELSPQEAFRKLWVFRGQICQEFPHLTYPFGDNTSSYGYNRAKWVKSLHSREPFVLPLAPVKQ